MRDRGPVEIALRILPAALLLLAAGIAGADSGPAPAERVVSLNPSLTAITLALGAGDRLVGIDDWSARQHDSLVDLPRVGGLYNPSLEAIVAVAPDLVLWVPSAEQRDLQRRLDGLGLRVERFENQRFRQVLENIERLGRLLGRAPQAARRIAAIREARRRVSARVGEREAPRTLLVLQRSPLFIAGRDNFLDEMVEAAGGRNLGRHFADGYPRVAVEWVIEAEPEVILDLAPDPQAARRFWARWPSLPAVAAGRVLALDPEQVSMPGPALDVSLELLAEALHGPPGAGSGEGPSGEETRRP